MEKYVYKQVNSIIFGLFSPKTVKKMASAKIVTPELYDKDGYPVDGGLMDIRLGVIDPGLRCKTCGGKLKECHGHFGYMELARPVIHVNYVKIILNVLRSTCKECGRILLNQDRIAGQLRALGRIRKSRGENAYRAKINTIIKELKAVNKCPHCKAKQGDVKIEKPTTFLENERRINPIEIRARLEKIPDDDCMLLGLNPVAARPEWMVLTVMAIPPVTMRPSITLESGERSEDDLTHKLGDVVRINQRLFENINAGAPEIIIEDLWDLLQYHITTFFDNTIANIPPARHRSGVSLKTLTERIKSKEGRFRHNLAGKRVNFSARTVISPDPKIKFNEVGIPKVIAMELTIPERVNDWNKERLVEFIKRGPTKYPGANYVVRPDGKKKKITPETEEQLLDELENGFIVERHLMDGDIAVFNRQPSLHRMSIMCHIIRVLPGRSFRLNPSVCVAPDTNVYLSSGINRSIDELRNCWRESELATFDWKKKIVKSTEVKKFWGLKPKEYNVLCYKISSDTGRFVIATEDHPFYTNSGIKRVGDIKIGDKVIVRPLDTPKYEEIDKVIVNKNQFIKSIPNKSYVKHSVKVLEDLKLLPFNMKDQRTMILARLLGHLFGDGTFILNEKNARLIFRGKKKDLETIQSDIKSLGFNPEKIYIKTSSGEIVTVKGKKLKVFGKGSHFEVRNKPLAILFDILGAPNGDKVEKSYKVPKWILDSPKYIKREFLASYFGSEMTKPALRHNSKSNFRTFKFKVSKVENKINYGYRFIRDLIKILKEFEVKITSISEGEGNIRKDGKKSISLCANINSNESQLNLLGKIGYIYNKSKDDLARYVYQYLKLKKEEIRKRKDFYKKFFEMRREGYSYKSISRKLKIKVGVLENWMYNKYDAGLMSDFITFDNWLKKFSLNDGLVLESVVSKKKVNIPFVYDVTTVADTHNFFANGFLTKNCHPYNADFDGDEMNLHIPQNEEARTEAEVLMQVQTQIVTPKNGLNVIGCVEDAVSGCYLLTRNLSFDKEDAIQLLLSIGIEDVSDLKRYSGKVDGRIIFSILLPKELSFITRSRDNERVIIKDGRLVEGIIDENVIGEENGTLIRELNRAYSKEDVLRIVNSIFKLGIAVLLKRGFTTSISDTDLPNEAIVDIKNLLIKAEDEVDKLIGEYESGNLEAFPGKTRKETLELKALEVLNGVRNEIGKVVAKFTKDNNHTSIMMKAGAKGNLLNLAQMAACVGQQALRGQRISLGYRDRTLGIFKRKDLGAEARGFIARGFKQGLKPAEFFFGAMTGRDSLMDTALRTPKSGYLYRRLANALQDLKVEYDNTVRNANSEIIQFVYGEDGLDVSKTDNGTINVKKIIEKVTGKD